MSKPNNYNSGVEVQRGLESLSFKISDCQVLEVESLGFRPKLLMKINQKEHLVCLSVDFENNLFIDSLINLEESDYTDRFQRITPKDHQKLLVVILGYFFDKFDDYELKEFKLIPKRNSFINLE